MSFTGRFAAALIAAVSARIFRRAAAAFGDVQFFAAVFEPEPQAGEQQDTDQQRCAPEHHDTSITE